MKSICMIARLAVFAFVMFASAWARAVELYVWEANPGLPPLILPVADDEIPEKAAADYRAILEKHEDLKKLFGSGRAEIDGAVFRKLSDQDISQRALLMANQASDLRVSRGQVSRFARILQPAGTNVYLLPVAAGIVLGVNDQVAFRRAIIEKFPMLVAMGGDDVDPRFYDDTVRYSVNTNSTRDRFEIELIRDYVKAEKGFFLGVCRGHQLTSAALGYKMIQDIPLEIGNAVHHRNDWHSIKMAKTSNGLLESASPDQPTWSVNSFHHQAVIYKPEGFLEIAAISDDGVTEAVEFRNGKGILLQFHPEYMDDDLGKKILVQVLKHKDRTYRNGMCSAVFTGGF